MALTDRLSVRSRRAKLVAFLKQFGIRRVAGALARAVSAWMSLQSDPAVLQLGAIELGEFWCEVSDRHRKLLPTGDRSNTHTTLYFFKTATKAANTKASTDSSVGKFELLQDGIWAEAEVLEA